MVTLTSRILGGQAKAGKYSILGEVCVCVVFKNGSVNHVSHIMKSTPLESGVAWDFGCIWIDIVMEQV